MLSGGAAGGGWHSLGSVLTSRDGLKYVRKRNQIEEVAQSSMVTENMQRSAGGR